MKNKFLLPLAAVFLTVLFAGCDDTSTTCEIALSSKDGVENILKTKFGDGVSYDLTHQRFEFQVGDNIAVRSDGTMGIQVNDNLTIDTNGEIHWKF